MSQASFNESAFKSENYTDLENEDPSHYKHGGYHPVKEGEVYDGKYQILKKIGWGHFSTVWLASDITKEKESLHKYVAIKFLKSNKRCYESAMIEVDNLQMIRSEDPYSEKNVVSLLSVFEHYGVNGRHMCLVFEVLGKNLLHILTDRECYLDLFSSNNPSLLPIKQIKEITRDILEGLVFLHDVCRLIHTDLKLENISICFGKGFVKSLDDIEMIIKQKTDISDQLKAELENLNKKLTIRDNDLQAEILRKNFYLQDWGEQRIRVKIVDLGNSVKIKDANNSEITTRQYRAPEVFLGQVFDQKVDIWSLACIVFELATGDFLFNPKKGDNLKISKETAHLALIIELLGEYPSKQILRKGSKTKIFFNSRGKLKGIGKLSYWKLKDVLIEKYGFEGEEAKEMADFLTPMLRFDPALRVSAAEALKHEWLKI